MNGDDLDYRIYQELGELRGEFRGLKEKVTEHLDKSNKHEERLNILESRNSFITGAKVMAVSGLTALSGIMGYVGSKISFKIFPGAID